MSDWVMQDVTDLSYNLMKRIESRKRRLLFIAIGCSLLASVGFLANAFALTIFIHQKGGFFDIYSASIALNLVFCGIVLAIGLNKYRTFKRYNTCTKKFELLENTIYREVLSHG